MLGNYDCPILRNETICNSVAFSGPCLMTRYYFHIHDSHGLIPDEEGIELPDRESAVMEARITARDFAASELKAGRPVDGRTILVKDEDGLDTYELPVR